MLPNPLKVPQQNPTATAEYAPVPGHSDQDAENGNFGETGLANSSGIGFGGNGSGAIPGFLPPPPPPPPEFRPRQKACVGTNPPRQTADPLSPPCVPFFDGDNGGSTYRGVTPTEIKVAFYNDLGVEGDMNTPYDPNQEARPDTAPYQNVNLVRTIKAQLRYFQTHYQTYGRTVHVIAQKSAGLDAACAARQGDAIGTRQDIDPFAAVHLGDNAQCYMAELAEKYQVPTFGLNSDVKRSNYESHRPYIWGFFPDQEAEAQWSAGFLCRSIAFDAEGKPAKAKWSNDPSVAGKPRKFGFITPQNSGRGPEAEQLAVLLRNDMKAQCGIDLDDHHETFAAGGSGPQGQSEAPTIMRKFKTEGVTTVICYCVPVPNEVTVSTMQGAAKGLNYFPEWYWDHTSRMFRAIWERQYGDPSMKSFGVSQHWRQPNYHNQYHYQSYQEAEPGTEPNAFFNFDVYHLFLNLFEAIQAAGPNLTPQSVEQGMFTFNYVSDKNPYVPTGGYGQYESNIHSPLATYTFVDTGMAWWWDSNGRAEGESDEGCLRVAYQGKRFYFDQWPKGDAGLFTNPPGPCTPDDRKLLESGATF